MVMEVFLLEWSVILLEFVFGRVIVFVVRNWGLLEIVILLLVCGFWESSI